MILIMMMVNVTYLAFSVKLVLFLKQDCRLCENCFPMTAMQTQQQEITSYNMLNLRVTYQDFHNRIECASKAHVPTR